MALRGQPVCACDHQERGCERGEAMGAVVITWDDVPHVPFNERIVSVPWVLHRIGSCWPTRCGAWAEPVAAVAAETEELAERAARAVVVEYEPLPVVTDPWEAMQPGRAAALRHVTTVSATR